VQQAYDEEIQRQQQLKNIQEFGTPEEPEQIYESGEIKPVSLLMAEGGPLDMQETPMAPNLSEQMPAQTEEVTQAEMQEAQGALQQILQVIDMLIQQGLSAEEIAQFLEQYGISEDELEQAAQILGVDINQLLGGQMQQPQEPMMMAAGGGANVDRAILAGLGQATSLADVQAMDNEPRFEDRSPENQIFSLQTSIDNLMSEYDMLVRNKEFDRAQAVANEINNIDVQISQIKAQMPMGLGEKKN
jgi:DNA-binding transcriptional MerR regulator